MIKVYIDVRTEASLQGSTDVKARECATLSGFSNAHCDEVLAVVAMIIRATATNVRACR